MHVIDAVTGKEVEPPIDAIRGGGSVSWLDDGSGFFYTRLRPDWASVPATERFLDNLRYFRKLGAPGKDPAVFGPGVHPDVNVPRTASGVVFPVRGTGLAGAVVVDGVKRERTFYLTDLDGVLARQAEVAAHLRRGGEDHGDRHRRRLDLREDRRRGAALPRAAHAARDPRSREGRGGRARRRQRRRLDRRGPGCVLRDAAAGPGHAPLPRAPRQGRQAGTGRAALRRPRRHLVRGFAAGRRHLPARRLDPGVEIPRLRAGAGRRELPAPEAARQVRRAGGPGRARSPREEPRWRRGPDVDHLARRHQAGREQPDDPLRLRGLRHRRGSGVEPAPAGLAGAGRRLRACARARRRRVRRRVAPCRPEDHQAQHLEGRHRGSRVADRAGLHVARSTLPSWAAAPAASSWAAP